MKVTIAIVVCASLASACRADIVDEIQAVVAQQPGWSTFGEHCLKELADGEESAKVEKEWRGEIVRSRAAHALKDVQRAAAIHKRVDELRAQVADYETENSPFMLSWRSGRFLYAVEPRDDGKWDLLDESLTLSGVPVADQPKPVDAKGAVEFVRQHANKK